jgi:hypothetical protein
LLTPSRPLLLIVFISATRSGLPHLLLICEKNVRHQGRFEVGFWLLSRRGQGQNGMMCLAGTCRTRHYVDPGDSWPLR